MKQVVVFLMIGLLSLAGSAASDYPNINEFGPENVLVKTRNWSNSYNGSIKMILDRALEQDEQLIYQEVKEINIYKLYERMDTVGKLKLTEDLAAHGLTIDDIKDANINLVIEKDNFSKDQSSLSIKLVALDYKERSEKESKKEWFIQVHVGVADMVPFITIFQGDVFPKSDFSTQNIGVEFGKDVIDKVFGLPITVGWRAGMSHYLEGDEYAATIAVSFKLKKIFAGKRIFFQLNEGLSYAPNSPPQNEINNTSKHNGHTSNLMNSITVSAGISLADLFNTKSMGDCYSGVSVKHRSGGFGFFKIFNNTTGGSDYLSVFVECEV